MSDHYRTQGFVFKREDRLDADRVFSVFTKEFGRVEIVGKAIRKISSKLRSGIEIFSLSDIEFIQGKHRKTLTDAVVQERFKGIYQSPQKLEVAYKMSDVLDSFIRGPQEDQQLFEIIEDSFEKLHSNKSPGIVYHYFFWNVMSVLGYGVETSQCVQCQEVLHPDRLYFSNKEGGILCKNCAAHEGGSKKVSAEVVKILRLILKKEFETLSKLKIEKNIQKSLNEVANNYYRFLAASHSFL